MQGHDARRLTIDESPLHGRRRGSVFGAGFLSRSLFLLIGLSVLLFPLEARAATSCKQAGVVMAASRSFINAARAGRIGAFERALKRHLAMRRIAMFALGRDARKLSSAEKARYVALAARYIARHMASRAGAFRNARVRIVRCRGDLVEGRIDPGGERMRWRLRGKRIVDVNMSGVWLALALRDHFRSKLRHTGGDVRAFLASLQ